MSSANVSEVLFSAGNAVFPTSGTIGTNVFGLGYAEDKQFGIKPAGEITGKSLRKFPSLREFIFTGKSEQLGVAWFRFLLAAWQANDVTAKVVTSGVSKATDFTASGGIFTFEDTKSLGIEFELVLSPTERYIAITAGKAFKETDAIAIITASTSDAVPGHMHIAALDAPSVIKAYVSPSFGSSITIADDRLGDWKISLKTRAKKNKMQKAIGIFLDVDIMGTMENVSPAEINILMAGGIVPDVTIAIGTATPWDLVLKTGGLTYSGEAKINEEDRAGTIYLTGSYDAGFADVSGSGVALQAQL